MTERIIKNLIDSMKNNKKIFLEKINDRFLNIKKTIEVTQDNMVMLELLPSNLLEVCRALRDEPTFNFEILLDICAVDYLDYGVSHWRTQKATNSGFSRGSAVDKKNHLSSSKLRFSVVYHLLSLSNNQRLRLRVFIDGNPPLLPSVISIWQSANWYEREAFDLFGIVFDGHPDLRRLLTDYGFMGHPFRKDFPLIGKVELRYDAKKQRCVYESVSIRERVLVPKVIRNDNRYIEIDKVKK